MELLLVIIILLFILPWLLRNTLPWLLQWFIRRQTRKFMNGAFPGGMPGANGPANNRQQPGRRPRAKRKKIDPSVGEYIEFIEIKGSSTTTAAKPNGPVESQVTDIEWEDLP